MQTHVKITYHAVEVGEAAELTGRRAEYVKYAQVVPRIGETLWVFGNSCSVADVSHDASGSDDRVQVDFKCDKRMFQKISETWELCRSK